MKSIIQLVGEHLERHEIKALAENNILTWNMHNEHGGWRMIVDTDDTGMLLSVISLVSMRVPLKQRSPFAHQLVRLNAGRRLGVWHLDPEDGELAFCVSVPTTGLTENLDAIMKMVFRMSWSQVGELQERLAEHAFQWQDPKEPAPTELLASAPRIQFN